MYGPTDLKKGAVIEIDGKPFKVIEYGQKVMGRGGSIVNVRVKNLIDGSVIPKTYKGQEKIPAASVTNRAAQFLYSDATDYFFMDPESFEQFQVPRDVADEASGYLKEGDTINLQLFGERIINVELPKNVPLGVTYTETVVKGDTSTNIQKDATLETGMIIKVPAFIKTGDTVSVDTETGQYRARV
jgi:elongation factor P